MQYKASTINRTALPRSKRMRALGAASVTPTVVNGESGDKYWNGEIDTETEETEVSTTYPVKISKRLRIVDESGALHGNISIDANGRFVFDKGIISKEDIIAYGVGGEDVKSVTDVIEEYLSEHGGGGYEPPVGGIPKSDLSSSVQASLGKADTALQEHQSLQGYATEQWVNNKGYLTSHQDISGKSNTTHTHSVKINGVTKTIAASGGTAVDLGTYLTSHQDISGKADKSSTVSTIAYDSTNKKITKTINGTTSDVVTVATLKSAIDAVTSTDLGNAISGEVQARITAINALDVASVGGSGKYIQSIRQTDGKISATAATLNKSAVGLGNVDNTADANKNVASAVCLVDYGNSSSKVYLAYSGTGYTAETASHLCATGMQDGNRVYRDITASEAKTFIGLGNVNNTSDADKPISTATQTALDGKRNNTAPKSGAWYAGTPQIGSNGVMEIGRYIDFHPTSNSTLDYGCRIDAGASTTAHVLTLPNKTGTLAITSDNVASATKLQNARTLWGNSFDGSANIDGAITMGEGADGRTVKLTNSAIKFIATSQNGWVINLVARNHADSSTLDNLIGGYGAADTYYYTYLGGTYNNPTMVLKGGNVGIGTTNPTSKLHVVGGSVYSDTAIRVPNCKPFASKLADGTDISLLSIGANNKVNVGNSSYLTDVNGSTIQLYNSSTEKVIIGSGNIATEVAATTERYVRVKNSNGEVKLSASANRGLYDTTNSTWIACYNNATSRTELLDGKVYIGSRMLTPAATNISSGGGIEVGNNKILSLANNLIFCADELRFSNTGTNWYYNNWAGLKYDSTNKKIYLGVADGTVFTSNTPAITGGTVQLVNCGLVASGDVTAYSDARLKSDIKDLEYRGPLEPKTYIKDGKKSIGFIAQEVRELYPELVLGEEKEDEYLSLNYGAITAVLAAENKELRNEVTELKNEVDELKKLINKLIEEK